MRQYPAKFQDTQAPSDNSASNSQVERRRRFAALQLSIPGLITGAELEQKIGSKPPKKVSGKKTDMTRINLGRFHA